jgi:hypothetical protein
MTNYANPWQQVGMLMDRVRVDQYAAAIAKVVKPGDVVLDIGSGNGLLALLAARAGARKVYAVERSEATRFVNAHAAENGIAGVIEVVHGDMGTDTEVIAAALKEKANVVVGELLGNFGPDEGQQTSYRAAVPFVRPDATYIPSRCKLLFAPTHVDYVEPFAIAMKDVQGLHFDFLVSEMRKRPIYRRVGPDDVCGPELVGWDDTTIAEPPAEIVVTISITKDALVQAIISNFDATLADGTQLSTSVHEPPTHWLCAVFPLPEPIVCRSGDAIRFVLKLPDIEFPRTYTWSAEKVS